MATSSNQLDKNMTVSTSKPDAQNLEGSKFVEYVEEEARTQNQNVKFVPGCSDSDSVQRRPRPPTARRRIKRINPPSTADGYRRGATTAIGDQTTTSIQRGNISTGGQKYGLSWFDDFQMVDDESVVDQAYKIFRMIADHAESCPQLHYVLNDKVELVNVIIEKLPESWEDYAATLKEMQMQKELSFGALVNHLRVEEENRAQDQKVEFVEERKEYSRYLPLYKAALRGDWATAERFFDQDPGALTAPINELSQTALYVAAVHGINTNDFVKKLVDKMPPGGVDEAYGKVLISASFAGNTEAVKVILSKNPSSVYFREDGTLTPLNMAALNGMRDTLLYLLEFVKNDDSSNLFPDEHSAAYLMDQTIRSGYYDIALYLVKKYPLLAFSMENNGRFGLVSLALKAASAFKSGIHYRWWQRIIYAPINANKHPAREPSYIRAGDISKVLKYKGVPGTRTAGRGRDANVLLGYDPAYKGFIDRRLAHPSTSGASTSTAPQARSSRTSAGVTIAGQPREVPISEGIPLPRLILRRSSRRQEANQQQPEQPAPQLTSQSSSSGYSPSPPGSGTMSHQPLNLSTLLTISHRGRGAPGRVASTGHAPPPPRRTRGPSTRSSTSPREQDSSFEATDAHRDKRPRHQEAGASDLQAAATSSLGPPTPVTQVIHDAWALQLTRGDRLVNVGDSASSSETALALAQGLLLPVDMQKESTNSSERLVSTGFISGIKFIQKMVTLGQRFQETEAEMIRLMNENTSLIRSVSRLERERDKAKLEANGMRVKLDAAEENLCQALSEIDSTKKTAHEDGFKKGFDAATASYVEQMPGIQDQIWGVCWESCLTKVGVPEDSSLWTDNDLPSKRFQHSHDSKEPPLDDIEEQIDDFADAEEDIQMESQSVPVESHDANPEQQHIEEASTDLINLEEQTTEGDTTTEVPSNISPEIQNLD